MEVAETRSSMRGEGEGELSGEELKNNGVNTQHVEERENTSYTRERTSDPDMPPSTMFIGL